MGVESNGEVPAASIGGQPSLSSVDPHVRRARTFVDASRDPAAALVRDVRFPRASEARFYEEGALRPAMVTYRPGCRMQSQLV
jgi:hypothetical protein